MVELEQPAARDWEFARSIAAVSVLVEAGRAHGVDDKTLLRSTGLDPSVLIDHTQEITAVQELRVVRNLVAARPALSGARVGARYHPTTFGIFGFAMLSSPTLLDAANLALRFIDLSFAFGIPSGEVEGDEIVITLDEDPVPYDVRPFLVERDLAAIATCLTELHPDGIAFRRVTFAHEPVEAPEKVGAVFGVVPSYGAARTLLAFDAAALEAPLPLGSTQARAMAEALCRDVVSRRRERHGITAQVRVLLTQHLAAGAPMERVAAELGLSVRTLRRRLAEAGTSYRGLLDEVRSSLAEELLGAGRLGADRMSVEDIAQRLGYAEATSFIVAFRRWTGATPAAWMATARR